MDKMFDRSIGLIGEEKFSKIREKVICIFGLGGVGGTAIEALVRTGFKNIILVDFDKVDETNLNRQILYGQNDIGKAKIDCACDRLMKINPDLNILKFDGKAQEFRFSNHINFVIDAIDDVDGKLYIAQKCAELGIPYIVSLGMANRFDPSKVRVSTLNKTHNDPLAKRIRYLFKQNNVSLDSVHVVWSDEDSVPFNGKLNSIMTVPSAAGLNIAYYVIDYFMKGDVNHE